MIFQVVYPFETNIYGDSYKEAIKNFIKLNRDLNITRMIIKDKSRQIEANFDYYTYDGRNKVGINMFPVSLQHPIPIVTDNNYIPPRVINPLPLSPDLSPGLHPLPLSPGLHPLPLSPGLQPLPLSSELSPSLSPDLSHFIPRVINIPNY
jgi:hypothetical protein